MESRAKLLGHPIHTTLIVFPLGLLGMAEIFDLLALAIGQGYWAEIALWMMIAGVVTGLIAAPFGLIDWLAIPAGTRAKRIGAIPRDRQRDRAAHVCVQRMAAMGHAAGDAWASR